MLELPEVEVLRKDLDKEVVGKRVKSVEVGVARIVRPYHRTRPQFKKALEGRKIEELRRRGTWLFFDLDEEQTWVVDPGPMASVHRETMNEPAGPDTDVVVIFTIGGAIHFTDPTGGESVHMGVVPTAHVYEATGVSETALDMIDDSPTWLEFGDLLRRAAEPLKLLLIDEDHLLGVRDVYSDEILFEAGLAHDRRSDTLSTQEVRRLHRAIQEVLQAAIKERDDESGLGEETPDRAMDEEGEPVEHLRVYGREGEPCPRCWRTLRKTRVTDEVVTYHCSRCQR